MNKAYESFDRDIEEFGTYQYTGESSLSSSLASRRLSEMVLSAVSFEGKSVVDVGCGDGTYSADLASRSSAASILGLDPAEKAIQRASELYGDKFPTMRFFCGTSSDLLEQSKQFDIAIYRGVIHHVPNPAEELSRAVRLARTILITEPNGMNPLMKAMNIFSPYHRQHQEKSFFPSRVARWITRGGGNLRSSKFFSLVPHFCPTPLAKLGKRMEPFIESFPILRSLCCGQYIIVASGSAESQ